MGQGAAKGLEGGQPARARDAMSAPLGDPAAAAMTLERMASVDRYNEWIFDELKAHVGRRLLEVGCGPGNMTPYFLASESLVCIDLNPEAVEVVRRKNLGHPNLTASTADICDAALVASLGPESFDTVTCINVLEHIEDDALALRHMRELLRPGGKLLLFVPAGGYLFGSLDRALGHHRRYSCGPLGKLVLAQGFRVEELRFMNAAGIPGWFLSSRILRRQMPPRGLLSLFNLIAPLLIRIERLVRPPFGQSLVCVASKE